MVIVQKKKKHLINSEQKKHAKENREDREEKEDEQKL